MAEVELLAMRAAMMFRAHPDTDWTHVCSKCGRKVGLYPSGQRVLKTLGENNVDIICNVCSGGARGTPAPGALEEQGQSARTEN